MYYLKSKKVLPIVYICDVIFIISVLVFYINCLLYVNHCSYDLVLWSIVGCPIIIDREYYKAPLPISKLSVFDDVYWKIFSWINSNSDMFFKDNKMHYRNCQRKHHFLGSDLFHTHFSCYNLSYGDKLRDYFNHLNLAYGGKAPYEYYVLDKDMFRMWADKIIGGALPHNSHSDRLFHIASGLSSKRRYLSDAYDYSLRGINILRTIVTCVVDYLDVRLDFNCTERRIAFFIMSSLLSCMHDFFFLPMNGEKAYSYNRRSYIFNNANYALFYGKLNWHTRGDMLSNHVIHKDYLANVYTMFYKNTYNKNTSLSFLEKCHNIFGPLEDVTRTPTFVMPDCCYHFSVMGQVAYNVVSFSEFYSDSAPYDKLPGHWNFQDNSNPFPLFRSSVYTLKTMSLTYHNVLVKYFDVVYDAMVKCCDMFDTYVADINKFVFNISNLCPELDLLSPKAFSVPDTMGKETSRQCLVLLGELRKYIDSQSALLNNTEVAIITNLQRLQGDSYMDDFMDYPDDPFCYLKTKPLDTLLFNLLFSNSSCRGYIRDKNIKQLAYYVDGGGLEFALSKEYSLRISRHLGWYGIPL